MEGDITILRFCSYLAVRLQNGKFKTNTAEDDGAKLIE
jgi:hypothetical protein